MLKNLQQAAKHNNVPRAKHGENHNLFQSWHKYAIITEERIKSIVVVSSTSTNPSILVTNKIKHLELCKNKIVPNLQGNKTQTLETLTPNSHKPYIKINHHIPFGSGIAFFLFGQLHRHPEPLGSADLFLNIRNSSGIRRGRGYRSCSVGRTSFLRFIGFFGRNI